MSNGYKSKGAKAILARWKELAGVSSDSEAIIWADGFLKGRKP